MRYTDISNPERVNREPDQTILLLSNGSIIEKGYKIKNIELRLYIEKNDKKLGQYSLITSLVETDKGSVEMVYDEGYRGNDALETSSKFLSENLGVSGLIILSLIVFSEPKLRFFLIGNELICLNI